MHLWEIHVGLTRSLKILVGNKLKFHIDHNTTWNQNLLSFSKPNEKTKIAFGVSCEQRPSYYHLLLSLVVCAVEMVLSALCQLF